MKSQAPISFQSLFHFALENYKPLPLVERWNEYIDDNLLYSQQVYNFLDACSVCLAQFNNFSLRRELKVVLATRKKRNESAVLRYYHNRLPSQNILIKDRWAQGRFFCCCEYCHDAAGLEFIYVVAVCVFFSERARTRSCIFCHDGFLPPFCSDALCVCMCAILLGVF